MGRGLSIPSYGSWSPENLGKYMCKSVQVAEYLVKNTHDMRIVFGDQYDAIRY